MFFIFVSLWNCVAIRTAVAGLFTSGFASVRITAPEERRLGKYYYRREVTFLYNAAGEEADRLK